MFHRFLTVGLAAVSLLFGTAQSADKVPVVASFSILGDLVRVVGGDRVTVITLVGLDEDTHVYEPKPADARAIVQSKLLVTNGLGLSPGHKSWFAPLVILATPWWRPQASKRA